MTSRPGARVFCHPVDLIDDLAGTMAYVATLVPRDCSGPAGLALASAYHSCCDYLPRNRRRVHYSPAGLAFAPDPTRFPAAIQPPPQLPICNGLDLLRASVEFGRRGEMPVDAWVVYLHHDTVAHKGEVEGRVVNAFGDVYPVALCPSSPDVGDYCEALTREVATRGPSSIIAEGLHHQLFPHGFHHDRMFGQHGGLRRFLLSLCFCTSCEEGARRVGVDVAALRSWVRRAVDGARGLLALPDPTGLDDLAPDLLLTGTVESYLDLRCAATTALIRRCAKVAASLGVGFTWLDATHAWAEPHATAEAVADPAWQIGCDLAAIGGVSSVATAAYGAELTDCVRQFEQVTATLGRQPDAAIVRILASNRGEAQQAVDRIRYLASQNLAWIGLYHLGLAPLPPHEALDLAQGASPHKKGGC